MNPDMTPITLSSSRCRDCWCGFRNATRVCSRQKKRGEKRTSEDGKNAKQTERRKIGREINKACYAQVLNAVTHIFWMLKRAFTSTSFARLHTPDGYEYLYMRYVCEKKETCECLHSSPRKLFDSCFGIYSTTTEYSTK